MIKKEYEQLNVALPELDLILHHSTWRITNRIVPDNGYYLIINTGGTHSSVRVLELVSGISVRQTESIINRSFDDFVDRVIRIVNDFKSKNESDHNNVDDIIDETIYKLIRHFNKKFTFENDVFKSEDGFVEIVNYYDIRLPTTIKYHLGLTASINYPKSLELIELMANDYEKYVENQRKKHEQLMIKYEEELGTLDRHLVGSIRGIFGKSYIGNGVSVTEGSYIMIVDENIEEDKIVVDAVNYNNKFLQMLINDDKNNVLQKSKVYIYKKKSLAYEM